jgi:hypothetical protein
MFVENMTKGFLLFALKLLSSIKCHFYCFVYFLLFCTMLSSCRFSGSYCSIEDYVHFLIS